TRVGCHNGSPWRTVSAATTFRCVAITSHGTTLALPAIRSFAESTCSGGYMSFHASKENGVVVVDVDGQLIVGNRQELKQKVLDELESGERKFLIDFANTGYIDSSGLGVLVSLSK